MECGGDGKAFVFEVEGGEGLSGAVDFGGGAGEDGLGGGVFVGEGEMEVVGVEDFLEFGRGGGDGEHGAGVVRGVGHGSAAEGGEGVEGRFVNSAGGAERDEFAEAVAGGGVGLDGEMLEDAPGAEADGTDGGLCGGGVGEGGFVLGAGGVGEDGDGVDAVGEAIGVGLGEG